jgi:hypothetical protein
MVALEGVHPSAEVIMRAGGQVKVAPFASEAQKNISKCNVAIHFLKTSHGKDSFGTMLSNVAGRDFPPEERRPLTKHAQCSSCQVEHYPALLSAVTKHTVPRLGQFPDNIWKVQGPVAH